MEWIVLTIYIIGTILGWMFYTMSNEEDTTPHAKKTSRVILYGLFGVSELAGLGLALLIMMGSGFKSIGLGWQMLILYLVAGLIFNIYFKLKVNNNNKIERYVLRGGLCTSVAIACIPILYVIGWLWYYFCGGFLVIDVADGFFEKVVYGLITVVAVGSWVGLILILLKKM